MPEHSPKSTSLILPLFILLVLAGVSAASNQGYSFATVLSVFRSPASYTQVEPTESREHKLSLGHHAPEKFVVPSEGKIIYANLDTMKLVAYEDGESVMELEIIGKGKYGYYWETPGGRYQILLKERNHLSSTGGVWMPYSMQFFGNYFIHGRPYFPDGTPTPLGYSGGCIRLSVEDAGKLFEWTDIGTTLHIDANTPVVPLAGSYYQEASSSVPTLSARSYLVGDMDTGDVLVGENISVLLSPSSLTKLMSAVVELGVVNQQRTFVADSSLMETSTVSPLADPSVLVEELINPLILNEGDEAIRYMSSRVGTSHFIRQMNYNAKAFSMHNTNFADTTGESSESVTTVIDMFKFAQSARMYKSFIFNLSRKATHISVGYSWSNDDPLVELEEFMGGRVEDDAALVLFKVPVEDGGERNLAVVVLESTNPQVDVEALLEYIKTGVYFK